MLPCLDQARRAVSVRVQLVSRAGSRVVPSKLMRMDEVEKSGQTSLARARPVLSMRQQC